jgi:hypothetical protein
MKQQVIKLAMMTAAFVVVQAIPTAVTTEPGLVLRAVDGPVTIYLSDVTDTIFGENTENYDYIVHSDQDRAIESAHQFANAWTNGDEHDILVAFHNATMQGYMTPGQAADNQWLCTELYTSMQSQVEECKGIQKRDTPESVIIEARSRWPWSPSTSHVASQFAFNVLSSVLGSAIYANLPTSPRSVCDQGGCISWSKVETFSGNLAQQMVQDALSAQDLNRFSVEARGILGSRKRSGADVCLSNRPKGCT